MMDMMDFDFSFIFMWNYEILILMTIYHFKAQEVKNLTLQTVYDLELK